MKGLVGLVSALALSGAASIGASVTYDFDTLSTVPNSGGTLWDGVTTTNCGSVNWQQSGGAGRVGSTTNGPAVGSSGDGFLQLTFASPSCSGNWGSNLCGAWLLNDYDGGNQQSGFTFECDLRMGNGDPAPIGGFSVNFVRTNDPVLAAWKAGDWVRQMNGRVSTNGGRFSDYGDASDLSLMEQGTTTGVSVAFQMQDSGDYHIPPDAGAIGQETAGITHDGVGLHVRVDGTVIAAVPMPNGTTQQTYDQQGNPLAASDPLGTNAATNFRSVETGPDNSSGCDTNLLWVHFKIELSTNGVLNVWWKNFQVLTNVSTSLAPYPGRFLIAARVGSRPANIDLDNVQITTVVAPQFTNSPAINLSQTNGQWVITYTGTLQYSVSPAGGFQDWQGAASPFTVPLAHLNATPGGQVFFRSRW